MCNFSVRKLHSIALFWFFMIQGTFFSDANVAYICIFSVWQNIIDWRSLYVVVLIWIMETYSFLAIFATYIIYLIIDARLSPNKYLQEIYQETIKKGKILDAPNSDSNKPAQTPEETKSKDSEPKILEKTDEIPKEASEIKPVTLLLN